MIDFRADLHCHTTCSDGTVSPENIIRLAIDKNLQGLSITDHDTIEAYPTAMLEAEKANLSLISGVEFSAVHERASVHILAYSFPLNSDLIKEFCIKHIRGRENRNTQILSLLNSHGMLISEEDIRFHTDTLKHTIGRPHIAQAMMKKGYVSTVQEAFNKFIGDGKSCYASGGYFSVDETLDLIHRAKGLAVIAHPHLIEKSHTVDELLKMNFDGIEAYYAKFPLQQNERWIKIGMKKNWIITGGSDFHGDIKPQLSLGHSWVRQETFKILADHFRENQTAPDE